MAIVDSIKGALGMGKTEQSQSEQSTEQSTEQTKEPTALDKFAFLGENAVTNSVKDSNQLQLNRTSEAMTPEAIEAITAGLDFTSAISAQTLADMKEGKVEALLTAFNDMSKRAYLTALQHSGAIADNVLDTRLGGLEKNLPSNISSILTKNELKSSSVAFDNPVVRQAMNDTAARILKQHPDASPSEIAAQTKTYFTELAKAINPEANFDGKSSKTAAIPSVDWFEYALNN